MAVIIMAPMNNNSLCSRSLWDGAHVSREEVDNISLP